MDRWIDDRRSISPSLSLQISGFQSRKHQFRRRKFISNGNVPLLRLQTWAETHVIGGPLLKRHWFANHVSVLAICRKTRDSLFSIVEARNNRCNLKYDPCQTSVAEKGETLIEEIYPIQRNIHAYISFPSDIFDHVSIISPCHRIMCDLSLIHDRKDRKKDTEICRLTRLT